MHQYLEEFGNLNEVMKRLRAPDGCPWDRAQTMETLCPHVIEEAYELVDAIESSENENRVLHIREECGDLLLQTIFIATLAEEAKEFDIGDVCRSVTQKLVRRHPRIFSGTGVEKADDAYADWEKIKRQEREQLAEKDSSVLSGVPRALPPLIKASRLQGKAASVGFDWAQGDQRPIMAKIAEELNEVEEALSGDREQLVEELGDLLFAVVNLSRRCGIDPNQALSRANDKFERRFRHIERCVEERGGEWKKCSLGDLIRFWEQAKKSSL